jgi:phosphoglycolate phosphatase
VKRPADGPARAGRGAGSDPRSRPRSQPRKPRLQPPGAIRALAFDLDGTLVDSAPDIGQALNRALHGQGLPRFDVERVREWIGDGPDRLIDRALAALGRESDAALHATLRRGFDAATLDAPLEHGLVYDGVTALLERLHGLLPMAVVTNKPTPLARAVLDAAGLLPRFVSVHGADRAEQRKPAPALLEAAAAALEVDLRELLVVGDAATDLGAARAAGAPAAIVAWGYGRERAAALGPDWIVDAPLDLLRVVDATESWN